MILPDKKIKEERCVHFYNDAKERKGAQKFYASIWFTDGSWMFYNYIFAKNRECAFKKLMSELKDCLNYIDNVSLSVCDWN